MWGSGLTQNQMLFGKSEKPFQPAEADGRAPGAWFCLVSFLLKHTFYISLSSSLHKSWADADDVFLLRNSFLLLLWNLLHILF